MLTEVLNSSEFYDSILSQLRSIMSNVQTIPASHLFSSNAITQYICKGWQKYTFHLPACKRFRYLDYSFIFKTVSNVFATYNFDVIYVVANSDDDHFIDVCVTY